MFIKDNDLKCVREYGTNHHDSLRISEDGRCLYYENLQCGEGSEFGTFTFVTNKDGKIPQDDETLCKYGAEAYFNIGGFDRYKHQIRDLIEEYQHNIELLEEDRKDDKITISNAYRVAKIGVYTKVIMDLKAILEGEAE